MKLVWLAGVLAACYSPVSERPCTISCETTSDCPGELVCSARSCTLGDITCGGDGGIDTPIVADSPFTPDCAGLPNGLLANTCFPGHTGDITLGPTIDTNISTSCDPGSPSACFIVANSIVVSGTVTVTGLRPLVLWSASSITVDSTGFLDVASHRGGSIGPASDPSKCTTANGVSETAGLPQTGSGGNGGTYASQGGAGGAGRTAAGVPLPTGVGPQSILTVGLHGGCSGGAGGLSGALRGGAGGGAVYLMARDSIVVNGTINASGAGGGGGRVATDMGGGGGGGGAGGLIAFDAPLLDIQGATLIALGGGGGGGAKAGGASNNGKDPPPTGLAPGGGGALTITDNHGGDGGSILGGLAAPGGAATASSGGGGGGGGGAGFILFYGTQLGAPDAASPPLQHP